MRSYTRYMNFIKKWFSEKILSAKKKMYEADAEKVTIRINSLPEWLYKITLEHPEKIEEKLSVHMEVIKKKSSELQVALEGVRLKDILNMSISRYKKEVIKTSKDMFLKRMRQLKSSIDKFTKYTSINDIREHIDLLRTEIAELEEKNVRNIEYLEEFYSSEIPAVVHVIADIKKELIASKHVFTTQGYHKVNTIIELIESIKLAQEEKKKYESEITSIDSRVDETQKHVFKLHDKIVSLKNSRRYQDILSKEQALAHEVHERAEFVDSFVKRLALVDEKLAEHSLSINEATLVSGYLSNPDQALLNDDDLSITDVFESLLKELRNKESPLIKGLKETRVQKMTDALTWLIKSSPSLRNDLIESDRKIKLAQRYLKNYVILSEIQDNESRMEYYQKKLREIVVERKEKVDAINSLKISSLKDKLHKELLILTGYDVDIIY